MLKRFNPFSRGPHVAGCWGGSLPAWAARGFLSSLSHISSSQVAVRSELLVRCPALPRDTCSVLGGGK